MTKLLLATGAALAFGMTIAQACPYSRDTTASVERPMTVASISGDRADEPRQTTRPAEQR